VQILKHLVLRIDLLKVYEVRKDVTDHLINLMYLHRKHSQANLAIKVELMAVK
jgi:hypothetical protein